MTAHGWQRLRLESSPSALGRENEREDGALHLKCGIVLYTYVIIIIIIITHTHTHTHTCACMRLAYVCAWCGCVWGVFTALLTVHRTSSGHPPSPAPRLQQACLPVLTAGAHCKSKASLRRLPAADPPPLSSAVSPGLPASQTPRARSSLAPAPAPAQLARRPASSARQPHARYVCEMLS